MAPPVLSTYALCDPEDVQELLGYTDTQLNNRIRTVTRVINGATTAIRRRSQREFKQTAAEQAQTRYIEIQKVDVDRGYVRLGDFSALPSEVKIWTPDRDISTDLDVNADIWNLPDTPELGMPYEFLKVKSYITLTAGYWLSVKTDWGFPAVPDDITQVAIGTAVEWVLNDVMKLSELARQQGRPMRLQALIPPQYQKTVDDYRIYRVA